MSNYADPILNKYIELIKANNPDIKAYYQGDPIRVGSSVLPAVLISKFDTRVGKFSNAEDEYALGIRITVITDIRADLSTSENDAKIVEGIARLYDICEGREADYTLKASSILDILRANEHVDSATNLRTDLGSLTRVDYGENLRDRTPELWTVEARIEFVANFIQVR